MAPHQQPTRCCIPQLCTFQLPASRTSVFLGACALFCTAPAFVCGCCAALGAWPCVGCMKHSAWLMPHLRRQRLVSPCSCLLSNKNDAKLPYAAYSGLTCSTTPGSRGSHNVRPCCQLQTNAEHSHVDYAASQTSKLGRKAWAHLRQFSWGLASRSAACPHQR